MKGKYPILSVVAIRILSIAPTSAISERNCSTLSLFIQNYEIKTGEKIDYIFWNIMVIQNNWFFPSIGNFDIII